MAAVDKRMIAASTDPAERDRLELDTFVEGRPRPRGQYSQRTHDQLVGDFNIICDKLAASIRERDLLRRDLRGANTQLEKLKYVNLKFWILSGLVTAQTGAIALLGKELLRRLH